VAALWWAVIASGIYHGLNPGMGWPLAVSAALFEQKPSALLHALAALAIGHFIAMTAILLPFSLMITLVEYERQIRIGAGLMVIALGIYLLIIGIAFTVATAHTAAMMLAGGILAAIMYYWLGLKFLSRSWFNLDVVWALSLVVVGVIAIWHTLS